jgi:anti-sigma factor RsiW
MNCHEADRLLDAYVDAELGLAECAVVQEHVASCVSCTQRLDERQSLSRLIRRGRYYTAPTNLRAAVRRPPPHAWLNTSAIGWAAAIALVASLGGATIVRTVRSRATADRIAALDEDVVSGHVRALMGQHLFDVRSTDQHTVKPWFLGKLDFSPPVNDLASIGFPLIGGRLDYIGGRAVAALVYQRRQHTINVFIWPESRTTSSPAAESIRGFYVQHWNRDQMSFWAVSDLNQAELKTFARALDPP